MELLLCSWNSTWHLWERHPSQQRSLAGASLGQPHLDFVMPLPEADAGPRQRVMDADAVLAGQPPAPAGQIGCAAHAAAPRRLCAARPAQPHVYAHLAQTWNGASQASIIILHDGATCFDRQAVDVPAATLLSRSRNHTQWQTCAVIAPCHLLICLLSGATPRPCSSSESPFMLLCLRMSTDAELSRRAQSRSTPAADPG